MLPLTGFAAARRRYVNEAFHYRDCRIRILFNFQLNAIFYLQALRLSVRITETTSANSYAVGPAPSQIIDSSHSWVMLNVYLYKRTEH